MPDFERILDDMSIHFAKTPEKKKEAKAFIRGKNYARIEILLLFCTLSCVGLSVYTKSAIPLIPIVLLWGYILYRILRTIIPKEHLDTDFYEQG